MTNPDYNEETTTATQTCQGGKLGDFFEVRGSAFACGNEEQLIAVTEEFYNMALQVVMDNDFCQETQDLFPRWYGSYHFENIRAWWGLINIWYAAIPVPEQAKFSKAEVTWS